MSLSSFWESATDDLFKVGFPPVRDPIKSTDFAFQLCLPCQPTRQQTPGKSSPINFVSSRKLRREDSNGDAIKVLAIYL